MKLKESLLSALIALPLAFSAVGAAHAEKLNMYTFHTSLTIPPVVGLQKLADEVAEATSNEIDIDVLLSGTLQINAADTTGAVAANIVQMADDLFFSGNVPVATVLRLPLIVGSPENMDAVMDASFEAVKKGYAARGITLLGGYVSPPQYIWVTKEVGSVEDLKGLKLRVSSPEQAEFVKAIGGIPVTLPPAEVTSALERGIVEGMLTSGQGGEFFGGPLKSALLLPVNYNNDYLIINTRVFENLSPENQEILADRTAAAAQWIQEEFLGLDNAAIDKFRARDDFKVVEPSEADYARASEIAESSWQAWVEKNGADGQAVFDAVRQATGN